MFRKRLIWRIYFAFMATATVALAAMAWYAAFAIHDFNRKQASSDLRARARIVVREMAALTPGLAPAEIDRICKDMGRVAGMRITVIMPDGKVAGDTEENPEVMRNHGNRVEVQQALQGMIYETIHYSATLKREMLYSAMPVQEDGAIIAVVRVALPLAEVEWPLKAVYRQLLLGGALAAILFALAAFYISRRLARPLQEMRRVAERLAAGDLDARLRIGEQDESGALAQAINRMAAQLGERMATIISQRNAQEAVLASMIEGVLSVDPDERILDLNLAAARILDLEPAQARGRSIQEAVRNPELQKFIGIAMRLTGTAEDEIVIYGKTERHLQLHGTALKDAAGNRIGALIVFNDITRLKRLENVRRDFVANVSHELKTPVAALKGAIETMIEGAALKPEEFRQFAAMIIRQTDRLHAIVDDLLSIARLEHAAEHGGISVAHYTIADILRQAVKSYSASAAAKEIPLGVECPADLAAMINGELMEQAVGNLLDNAIKYSGNGARITVSAAATGDIVEIKVADQGPGIEKRHLDRIFERFYRVDQARSRSLGGTGLGLAIVKHIAMAHRGTVGVESEPGRGSTFTIRIPRA